MLAIPDDGVPVLRSRSARWRRIVIPLLVAVIVAAVALLLAGRGGQSQIVGAGSTLAQPLIERSATSFRDAQNADDPERPERTGDDWVVDGGGIAYEPVGSMGGIQRLSDPEVDFAISDYPLSAQGLTEIGGTQFPIALGSVAVVHNLDLPDGQQLRLNAATLAGIYLGDITRWNADRITALNPGVTLPDLAITAVHRSDGSGSTNALTRYLAAGSPDWERGPGVGTEVTWSGGTAAERSGGLVDAVKDTAGSIGYVEVGQARRAELGIVELGNNEGGFVAPGKDSMLAAVSGHDWSGRDQYTTALEPTADRAAYPITVAIYAVVKTAPEFEQDTTRTLRYLTYLMSEYDGATADLGYIPLPADAATAVETHWNDALGASS